MAQLKRDGVKEIEITQDTLRGNVKFKEGLREERFECPNCKLRVVTIVIQIII